MIHKVNPTAMKPSAKTTLLLAILLMLGTTPGLKAQVFNFISLVGKVAGIGTGDMVFKGRNHNGVEWSFTVNVSYASKPILPAKQCLTGFSAFSNGVKVASFNKETNTAPAKMFISNNQAIAAIRHINIVSPNTKEQLPAFYPNRGVIKTQPAPTLIGLASL